MQVRISKAGSRRGGKQSCGKVGFHTLLFAGGSFCPGGGSRLGGQESALLSLSLSLRLSLKNHQQRMSITREQQLISCQLSHTELSEILFYVIDTTLAGRMGRWRFQESLFSQLMSPGIPWAGGAGRFGWHITGSSSTLAYTSPLEQLSTT